MEEGKLCEVRMRLESEDKNMKSWRQSETEQVKITKLFDMGWNKRNSGNRYDSLSGHTFMVGYYSQIIITGIITVKQCRICSSHDLKGKTPSCHDCPKTAPGRRRLWK